jgi:hypothetical protein
MVVDAESETLEMFALNDSARAAVDKARQPSGGGGRARR